MDLTKIRPKKRSQIRIFIGKYYFTFKRYFAWMFDKNKYAKEKQLEWFPYIIYKHKSILLRHLRGVDMWYQYNKIKNLSIAVTQLNGMVIKPGETFSYWRLIGKPTKRKGYVDGMVLFYGTYKKGI